MPNATEASVSSVIRRAILDCVASKQNAEPASANQGGAANGRSKVRSGAPRGQ